MKNPSIRIRLGAIAAATVVASVTNSPLLAANYTWQVAGTTNNWSTAAGDTNWFIDAGTTLSQWTDANAAILDAGTGETIALVGTVAPTSTTVNNNGNWVLNGAGVLGGTGGTVVKNGTGTLTISNTTINTFTGGTTINGGTLAVGTGAASSTTVGALGSGTVNVNTGGTLKLWIQANAAALTITNPLVVDGGNILNEDSTHTLSGNLTVGASGATLRSKWNGKTLTLTGVISGTGSPVTIARSADGGGSVDSAVILTNSNTYTGGTTVNSAVLQLGNAVATDKGGTGVIRGTLTANSPGIVTLGFTNALGYSAGAKVDTFNINGATVNHTANGDNGWALAYNFTGGTLQTTGTGRFSFGGVGGVGTTLTTNPFTAPATINGSIVMREGNPDNTIAINTADGAAANDLAINANMTTGTAGVGITKNGLGTLLINGAGNNFTGGTNINAGTLVLGSNGNLSTSAVTVGSGATFRSEVAGKTLPSLAAANTSGLVLPAVPSGTTTVTGALNLADGGTINVSPILGAGTVNGTYDLATAGSITGTGTVATVLNAFGATRATGSASINGNKIQFTVTGLGSGLVWNNASAGGIAAGTWDTNLSANFNNGGSNDVFKAFDSVTFDDTVAPAAAKTVNVAGVVAPASITVNNSTGNDYTLTAATAAAGTLTGATSIAKTGTGSLTLGANLNYTSGGGAISVTGGTFNLGGKTFPAHSSLTLTNGSTLSNGTIPFTGPFTFESGTISAAVTGPGTFTKTTAGTLTLSGATNITGAGTISAGTIQVGTGGTAGTIGSGPIGIASGANLTYFRSDNSFAAIANVLTGSGTVNFNGTGANLQSSYTISGNNSGFSGLITSTNSRVNLDNVNDVGTATLTTGTNGQFWPTAGVYTNPINLTGNGWLETGGPFGAIRGANGASLNGPITLIGDARISAHGSTLNIGGAIGESGGVRNLELGGTSSASGITLSGASTYTGNTTINTANVSVRGSLASPLVTVNNGSSLGGNGSIAGAVNFAGAATGFSANLVAPGPLTVAGNVTLGGITTVTVTPAPGLTPGGVITLMNYGSVTGTVANLAVANPTSFRQAILNVGTNSATLDLGTKAVTWSGTGGLTWDIGTTANWLDTTPAASAFYQGDTVTFTDAAGAANATVTVTAALAPASVTINNTTAVPYTFTGAGSVNPNAPLIKSGNGSALLTVNMGTTAGTTINGGSLIVDGNGNVNRQGAGNLITVNNTGTFEVRGVNAMPNAANSPNLVVNAGGTLRIVTGFSAGAPASNSHCHLGNVTLNGGTVDFTYSGSGTIYNGESFQLNGNVTVGGSTPSIIQSAEPITNQGLAIAASKTFTVADVTGSSASDLVITAEVENSDSNNGLLVKTGPGTLELAAANSYSAGTTLSQGTIRVSNGGVGSATGTGPVTTAAGTTITGDGTAGGAVTAAGGLVPGSATTTLRTGALTLTGSYSTVIDGADASVLQVTGNLNLTGATLNISSAGAGVTQNSYIVGSWTGTRTGAFGAVTGLPVGYSVQYDETNKFILVAVASGYTQWLAGFPGLSDTTPGGDPDKDGIVNLLEYTLGGNPTTDSSALLPKSQIVGSNLEFTFKRSDESEVDTTQVAQWSTTLDSLSWTDIAVSPTPAPGVTVTENGAAADDVKVLVPLGSNKQIFVRFKVTQN
ncbi:autotransporter-associated beta strand repeat-containing protein [Haloferula sp. BvORR071]|uniref:beta strand repeat-containing protein n=1 Tax=Haloferula sp. BvORR071 TaxID=1396141 RepID=UPI000556B7E4|nr:autotransporter-associated beta strand repeat-containing protein [Haloferula sp. BvORR071]